MRTFWFLAGLGLILFLARFWMPDAPPHQAQYTKAPPTYYVCGILQRTTYHLCSRGPVRQRTHAIEAVQHWFKLGRFRGIRVMDSPEQVQQWQRQGTRCVAQHGGNCS